VSERLVLLATSATVRPGLLSWPAWQVLGGGARVLAGSAGHPLLPALDEAGIGWQLLPGVADVAGVAGGDGAGVAGLARLLAAAAAAQPGTVVWLCDPEGAAGQADGEPEALARALDKLRAAGTAHGGGPGPGPGPGGGPGPGPGPGLGLVEVLRGSADLPGGHLLRLVAVMDTLRTECPWDARQTHDSLAPHLLEESYEALEALEDGDAAALREELGDVLLQVVFNARVAAERSDGTGYTIDDVADGIVSKLVRRHPHVFADVTVSGADEVKLNWDAIKAAERESASGVRASALDGVPFGQPALALAAQLQRRAERAGVPPELAEDEGDQGGQGSPGGNPAEPAGQGAPSDLGAELFALVARARAAAIDPELALRAAARRYRDRVHDWEQARQP
jgi:XTP/dITP diphosphohydrolase